MKKLLLICSIGLCIAQTQQANAQGINDPLLYGGSSVSGTARFSSMGGAFAAVGGDGSAVVYNPAGSAVFINSQMDVSLGITGISSSFLQGKDFKLQANIPNLSIIFTSPIPESKWKTLNFGFAANRVKHLFSQYNIDSKPTPAQSIVDFYLGRANGYTVADIESQTADPYAEVAYDAYIIDPDTSTTDQYTTTAGIDAEQNLNVERKGKITDYEATVGANYNNKLYLGMNFGFSSLTYSEEFVVTENYKDGNITTVGLTETNDRLGTALLLKLGAIYRITNKLRIGAYYHIPRLYRITNTTYITADADFNDNTSENGESAFEYSYRLKLPSKLGVGLSYILNSSAIFSLEGEKTSLSKSQLALLPNGIGAGADKSFFAAENADIKQVYEDLYTLKAGLEVRIKNLSIRGGMNYQTIAFEDSEGFNSDQFTYTAGLGYRYKTYAIDAYFVNATSTESYSAYDNAEIRKNSINQTSFGLGLSLFF